MSDGLQDGEAPAPAELLRENELLRAEITRLRGMLGIQEGAPPHPSAAPTPAVPPGGLTLFEDEAPGLPQVDAKSSAEEKIGLFRALFAGRDDVYATRWSNPRTGKEGWSPAVGRRACQREQPGPRVSPLDRRGDRSAPLGSDPCRSVPAPPDDSYRPIRTFFRWAGSRDLLASNPVEKVAAPVV